MTSTIRSATLADFPNIVSLSDQLGYKTNLAEIQKRFEMIHSDNSHNVFIIESNNEIHGWAHAYIVNLLESDGYVEIGGIVVDENMRGKGLGTLLIEACEKWAIEQGKSRVRLYSGDHRKEAHAFYISNGYNKNRPASAFEKTLSSKK